MVIGTALGWSTFATIVLAVVLAFVFGNTRPGHAVVHGAGHH